MKNLTIAVLFPILFAPFPATAQTKAPAKPQAQSAVPAQKPAPPATAAVAAPAQAVEAKAMPVKRASHRVPSTADARVCLEFPTNLQIIKCADKYRWAS